MYNPLPLLTPGLLQNELEKGKRWFVRQTYPRGMTGGLRAAFLIRGYPETEKQTAEQHLTVLQNDRFAFLYDAGDPEHLEKLGTAAKQPTGYKIYYAARKGVEWKPPSLYQQKLRHYIRSHHPAWLPQDAGKKIEIGLYEEFGQLFLKFSYKGEDDTIPFDIIETY